MRRDERSPGSAKVAEFIECFLSVLSAVSAVLFLLGKRSPRKLGQLVAESKSCAWWRNSVRSVGFDLLAEFIGGVETGGMQSFIAQQLTVSLPQAHGGPECHALSERMIHAVRDDYFHAGVRCGEGEGKRVL